MSISIIIIIIIIVIIIIMKFWKVLPQATFLVANGNKIIACNFARFAANDVKANKVPLEMEPVFCGNIIGWMLIVDNCQ